MQPRRDHRRRQGALGGRGRGVTLAAGTFPAGAIDPADVVDALVAAGIRVREIALETPTLEEVFLELVEGP